MASEVAFLGPPCLLRHHYADWGVDALMWASALSCPHVRGCVCCVYVCVKLDPAQRTGGAMGRRRHSPHHLSVAEKNVRLLVGEGAAWWWGMGGWCKERELFCSRPKIAQAHLQAMAAPPLLWPESTNH